MIQSLFDQNIIIYTFAGLCGLGLISRFLVNILFKRLVKESDNLGATKNKLLKRMKLKFETCYKVKIGVNNVDTFVDKNVLQYRFCGILLSTWENISGQVLFLSLLSVPVIVVFGNVYHCGQDKIMLAGSVGILASSILILVDKSINLISKKRTIKLNLMDYLENFLKVRMEQEIFHPEQIDQYRREYFQTVETGKQISAAAAIKDEQKDELNNRRESRQKKEEEKKALLIKREEEQRLLDEARKEEARKKLEERKQLAAKRRQEELMKIEEERLALEARRAQEKKKAEEKQQAIILKQQEKEKLLRSMEREQKAPEQKKEHSELLQGMDEIAVEKERDEKLHNGKEKVEKERQTKAYSGKGKGKGISTQEEELLEDVLKEFFA